MGRKRKRLDLSRRQTAEAHRLLKTAKDIRETERLRLLLWAASGRFTLEALACKAGRSRSTIQNWIEKYERGGLRGLLERNTPPGRRSPVAEPRIQAEMLAGLRAGQWDSASQVADWLWRKHGVRRARKSIYYWIARNGGLTPGRGAGGIKGRQGWCGQRHS